MADTQTLPVIARIVARPETVDEVKAILVSMIEPTRQEAGCLIYELFQCETDPTDFTFVEEWTDAAALAVHAASPHIAGVQGRLLPLLAQEPSVRTYRLIEN